MTIRDLHEFQTILSLDEQVDCLRDDPTAEQARLVAHQASIILARARGRMAQCAVDGATLAVIVSCADCDPLDEAAQDALETAFETRAQLVRAGYRF